MGTALAIVDADSCPDCAAPVADIRFEQPALFRHGGYGADRHVTIRHCARFCGWHILAHVGEAPPAKTVAA